MVCSERQRINILILWGFEDRMRGQSEVCTLFKVKDSENHNSNATASMIFDKFEGPRKQ